jgi:hypothetical protein
MQQYIYLEENDMRIGKNPTTGENEIYLSDAEAEQMKEMVKGASLPLRRVFYPIIKEL